MWMEWSSERKTSLFDMLSKAHNEMAKEKPGESTSAEKVV
jgi:hypothetical protein